MHKPAKSFQSGELLLHRLRSIASLSGADADLLAGVHQKVRVHGSGSQILPEGEGHNHPRLITSGWACRPRILSDGRCQILSILLPGDIIGDNGDGRPLAVTPVVALTETRTISVKPLFDAVAREPVRHRNLGEALRQLSRLEEAQLLDHVVRLGRQTATQRVAHCLLEFYHRLSAIGFVHGGSFSMPLTQELLGDTLGLSLVHVNRTLSQLKRAGLIKVSSGSVTVLDVEALSHLADFLPPSVRSVSPAALYGVEKTAPRLFG